MMLKKIQQENQELKKQYCERTDCSGRLGNSKKVDQLEKELEQLKGIEKEHQRINGELRVENKELLDYKKGYFCLEQENKKYKEVIDKAIDLIEKSVITDVGVDSNNNIIHYHQLTEDETGELLDILKEVE